MTETNSAQVRFHLPGHTYTATVHSLDDLRAWVEANKGRIQDAEVIDAGSFDVDSIVDIYTVEDETDEAIEADVEWASFVTGYEIRKYSRVHAFINGSSDAACGFEPKSGFDFCSEDDARTDRCKHCIRAAARTTAHSL